MAAPLFPLLLTWMFSCVKGCLISLCVHSVSLRVSTLCTAGACLASKVKPGSLWNLTKASSGKGWKFTLVWRLHDFLLGHSEPGQGHLKPVSASLQLHSVNVSVLRLFPSLMSAWYSTNLYFFYCISVSTPRIGDQNYIPLSVSYSLKGFVRRVCAATLIFIFLLNGANLPKQTGAEWKDFKMRL